MIRKSNRVLTRREHEQNLFNMWKFRGKPNFQITSVSRRKKKRGRKGSRRGTGGWENLLLYLYKLSFTLPLRCDQSFKVYFWKCCLPEGFSRQRGCYRKSMWPNRKVSTVTVELTAPLWSAITWMETESDSLLMATVCRRPSARLGTLLRSTSACLLLFNLYLNSNSSSQAHKIASFYLILSASFIIHCRRTPKMRL